MITFKTAENALRQVYLGVVNDQLNNNDKLLAAIKHTTSDIWGKIICVYDYETQKETRKDLQDFNLRIALTDKAIRCCENSSGAFVNLLNAEVENMVNNGINEQLVALCNEICKDCGLTIETKKLINFLNKHIEEVAENIVFHELCGWCWLENENGNIIKQVPDKPLFVANLVKYGNYIIKERFLNKIKRHFKKAI